MDEWHKDAELPVQQHEQQQLNAAVLTAAVLLSTAVYCLPCTSWYDTILHFSSEAMNHSTVRRYSATRTSIYYCCTVLVYTYVYKYFGCTNSLIFQV